jgi:hypothetical protein
MASTEDNACLDWRKCSAEQKYKWLAKKNKIPDLHNLSIVDKVDWCTNHGPYKDSKGKIIHLKNGEKKKEWCDDENNRKNCSKTCYLNFPNDYTDLKNNIPSKPRTVVTGSSPYASGSSPYASGSSSSASERLEVNFDDSNKNIIKSFTKNDDKLKKYKTFLNKTGFVKMEINFNNLIENIIKKLDKMEGDKIFHLYINKINELKKIFSDMQTSLSDETKQSTGTQSIAPFDNTFRKMAALEYDDSVLEMGIPFLKEVILNFLNIISQLGIIFFDNKSNSNNSIVFYVSKALLENDSNNMTKLLDILNFEVDDRERRQFFSIIKKIIPNQKIVISNIINILITLSINTLVPALVVLKIYKEQNKCK